MPNEPEIHLGFVVARSVIKGVEFGVSGCDFVIIVVAYVFLVLFSLDVRRVMMKLSRFFPDLLRSKIVLSRLPMIR